MKQTFWICLIVFFFDLGKIDKNKFFFRERKFIFQNNMKTCFNKKQFYILLFAIGHPADTAIPLSISVSLTEKDLNKGIEIRI